MVTAMSYVLLGFPAFMLGPAVLFAMYSTGAVQKGRASLVALGSVEVTVALVLILGPRFPGLASVAFYVAIVAVAWWLGYLVRGWRTAADEHARRADELAATREELARYAVADERRRIARELHDVVAHSMTVVTMHAGTARVVAADDPTAALSTLGMIERLSREAVTEMRRLVGLLRDDPHSGVGLVPTPGLADLHGLIAQMVAAGLAVEVHIDGRLEEVPAGPALAAFRITQEALTNAAKHSGFSRVVLRVAVGDSELIIEIENEAPSGQSLGLAQRGSGLGMIGMRERVHLYDGSLTAGPVPGGGFRVAARIPLGREDE
jgi:signal transduction histidine kinase